MTQFLNFHTHIFPSDSEERGIYNLLIRDINQLKSLTGQWLSVGIHPWYVDAENWERQLAEMEKTADGENVLAIGECGLDRKITLPLETQLLVFDAQVQLAEKYRKPVIIHCVKAFNELLQWKKNTKSTVPLIVHGFNNNLTIAKQLLAHGFHFSLGTALLKPDSNAAKVISILPLEKLFLENDDRAVPIAMVYEAGAAHLDMSVSELQAQIWANFAALFPQMLKK